MGKKYKTKFPMARIKKIMQTDDEIGKVASAVPVLVSKALELFLESLIESTCAQTRSSYGMLAPPDTPRVKAEDSDEITRRASTSKRMVCSTTHLKRCIESSAQFDFLKDLVKDIKDIPDEALSPLLSSPKVRRRGPKKNASTDSLVSAETPSAPPKELKRGITLKLPKIISPTADTASKNSISMLVNAVNEDPRTSSPGMPTAPSPRISLSPIPVIPSLAGPGRPLSPMDTSSPVVSGATLAPLISPQPPRPLSLTVPPVLQLNSTSSKPSALLQEEEDYDS